MTSYYTLPLLLLLLFHTTPGTTQSLPHKPQPSTFTKIYAFGDSYTDTGNTMSTTGPSGFNFVSSLPYGMTYFHHPTNRYSDGRLVIDFVAEYLALPLIPPYKAARGLHGVNFAVAGSTAIEHEFFVKNNLTFDITPESLGTQLGWFDKVLEEEGCSDRVKCGALFDDALVWVGEIGANDYAYSIQSELSKGVVQSLAINRISSFLQAILTRGAKYVVIQGLPPTGCLTLALVLADPEDRDDLRCVKSADIQSSTHNTLLLAEIQLLRKQFPKSLIIYADYYKAYHDIVKAPSQHGFKELFKSCCGAGGGVYNYDLLSACGSPSASPCSNPSQYVNWDGVHLTEAMYKAVSGLLIRGGYCRPSFQELLSRKNGEFNISN